MVKTVIRKLIRDEAGATAIEYGILIAMIALSLVVAFGRLGGSNSSGFQATLDRIGNAIQP